MFSILIPFGYILEKNKYEENNFFLKLSFLKLYKVAVSISAALHQAAGLDLIEEEA